jgi:hypothetical protein
MPFSGIQRLVMTVYWCTCELPSKSLYIESKLLTIPNWRLGMKIIRKCDVIFQMKVYRRYPDALKYKAYLIRNMRVSGLKRKQRKRGKKYKPWDGWRLEKI